MVEAWLQTLSFFLILVMTVKVKIFVCLPVCLIEQSLFSGRKDFSCSSPNLEIHFGVGSVKKKSNLFHKENENRRSPTDDGSGVAKVGLVRRRE